ncbi:MAG: hypothetical protein JRG96_20305 [Deltaproteobacteria bacterium]|nr:hypothetical protein [Deltaproteobacteria bacterium]
MTIRRLMIAGGTLLALASGPAAARAADTPGWHPEASERLIKLPSALMARSIERDFEGSALAEALGNTRDDAAYKAQTLHDLKAAAERADDSAVRTELRHQYLAEKRDFIALMGRQQELERQRVEVRKRLYAKVLDKLERTGQGISPQNQRLLDDQDAAAKRFESSVAKVDLELFGSGVIEQSRYAKDFRKNLNAIEKLTAAIQTHPMNAEARVDGDPVSKQDYLRHLLAETESDIAILDQENAVLGYMAKLVALDAMALAEGIEDPSSLAVAGNAQDEGVLVSVVELFVD